jgi:hypothetical protein
MAAQNELFETPLYAKEDDETITPEEEQCLRYIETLDQIYLDERQRIVDELKSENPNYWFFKFGDDFDSIAKALTAGVDSEPDETFANILAVTEELYQDASNPDDPDALKKAAERYKNRATGATHQKLGSSSNELAKKLILPESL